MSAREVIRQRSGSGRLVLVVLVGMVILGGAAFWLPAWRDLRTSAGGGLTVAEDALDFGEAWSHPRFAWTLPVHNPTTRDVEILDIKESCGCLAIEPKAFVISPGETVEIQLELDLRAKVPEQASQPIRPFFVELAPQFERALPGQAVWRVEGQVLRSPLRATPAAVDFGESLLLGMPPTRQVVRVEALEPLTKLVATCDESVAAVRVTPSRENPDEYEIEIAPRPGLSAGDHRFEVSLKGTLKDAGGRPGPPEWPLPVSARVHTDVQAAPSTVFFGASDLGTTVEETVLLSSRSHAPFQVVEFKKEGADGVDVEPREGDQAGAQCYRIAQRVTRSGKQQAEVRFVVREEHSGRSYEIPVALSYHGLQE